MRRRISVLIALCSFLGFVVAGCGDKASTVDSTDAIDAACAEDPQGCVRYSSNQPIVIGALLWLSEDSAAAGTGVDSLRGVELAIDYLDGEFDGSTGTALGHEVRLDPVDDGCEPAAGRKGAERLAAEDGLLAVVGTTCSSAAIDSAAEVLSDEGIVLISPDNTAPELTSREGHAPFYARTAPNDLIQGSVVGDFAVGQAPGGTALAMSDGTAYSDSLAEAFSSRFEDAGGSTDAIKLEPTDSAAAISAKLASVGGSPDIVYVPLNGDLCSEVVSAVGPSPGVLLTSDGCFNSEVLQAAESNGVTLNASGPDVRDLESNRFYEQELLPAYRESFGESPTAIFHAHAFDAANLVFDAFRRSVLEAGDGSLAVPRSAFRAALFATEGYDGFSGTLSCNDLGDCQVASLISIYASPDWPVEGGNQDARPIYSQSLTLEDVIP